MKKWFKIKFIIVVEKINEDIKKKYIVLYKNMNKSLVNQKLMLLLHYYAVMNSSPNLIYFIT